MYVVRRNDQKESLKVSRIKVLGLKMTYNFSIATLKAEVLQVWG